MAKKKIHTGQAAENAFVTGMGGKLYKGQAGSQATDIVLHHPDHGKFDGEMKAGGTIDFSQMRMDVDHSSGHLRQTVGSIQSSGDVSGKYTRPSGKTRDVIGLVQRLTRGKQLTPGTQDIERESRTKVDQSGNPVIKKETRPAAMGEVPTKRLGLKNRNAVSMMNRADPVHVAIHHKTGEVALIPTKDEHTHLGDKMGLKKTVTYDHLGGKDHGHKNTLGVKLRGPRPKGGTFNASVESSSGAMVDAVKDAGGHVFDSLDHATEHLRSHGWGAETGHAMREETATVPLDEECVQKLYELYYMCEQLDDGEMISESLEAIKNKLIEGIFNPEKGYPEIWRKAALLRGATAQNQDRQYAAIGRSAVQAWGDEQEDSGKTADAGPEKRGLLDTGVLEDILGRLGLRGTWSNVVTPIKEPTPKLKEQMNSSDEDEEDEENTSGTKPGQDQEVPYQTPEPGEKIVNADAGGGSPYVKPAIGGPAKTVMLGDDELEEGIRKSFSDFLLKEKNIDIGVMGVMEPFADTNKDNINQTASMLIAAMANKNNKKEKEHSCGCPHNK